MVVLVLGISLIQSCKKAPIITHVVIAQIMKVEEAQAANSAIAVVGKATLEPSEISIPDISTIGDSVTLDDLPVTIEPVSGALVEIDNDTLNEINPTGTYAKTGFHIEYESTWHVSVTIEDKQIENSITLPGKFEILVPDTDTTIHEGDTLHVEWTRSTGAEEYFVEILCTNPTVLSVWERMSATDTVFDRTLNDIGIYFIDINAVTSEDVLTTNGLGLLIGVVKTGMQSVTVEGLP